MIDKYIKELLFESDCVTVPGLGSFICTYQEAEISIAKSKISPPRKNIAFNIQLTKDDKHVLIDRVAKGLNISSLDAFELVKDFVKNIHLELDNNGQAAIEDVGRFYKNELGVIFFEQNLKSNFYADSFGLPELYFNTINRNQSNNSKNIINNPLKLNKMSTTAYPHDEDENINHNYEYEYDQDDDNEDEEEITSKSKSYTGHYILAALILLITIGTTYYISMDKETYAIGNFNPFSFLNKSPNPENKLLVDASEPKEPYYEESKYYEEPEPAPIISETKKAKKAEVKIQNLVTDNLNRYYLIAGGFKSKARAAALEAKLLREGNNAKVIAPTDETDIYRVSVADFDTYQDAKNNKGSFAEIYGSEIWIFNY